MAVGSEVSRGTPTLYVMGVSLREDQATTSIAFLDILLRANFRIINRLARMLPTLDAVTHDANVSVSCFNRPPGGFMRSLSMQVGAVEYEFRALVGRQFVRHIVLVVACQKMRARDDTGASAGPIHSHRRC